MKEHASGIACRVVCMTKFLAICLAVSIPPTAGAESECDLDNGKSVFTACAACHTYVEANLDKSGPNLHGVFGRKAGSLTDYKTGYSQAMSNSDIVWNEETLDKFLANPGKYVVNTTMAFIGVRNDLDRRDLICYLEQVTQ